jgi:benzoyl-CoA reductase/2-hydroxyglutaryl-CoA dehydratase subunit BcrC/BadD/HgdB
MERKSEFQKTDSGKRLTNIMAKTYMDLHQRAANGAFVVWVAIVVPVELFLGFDNVVYGVPESHAALSAARGVGPLQCEKAEKMGYSIDLCSYAKIDIGTVYDGGKDSPTFGLPKPHLLVTNNNNCSLLAKWFDIYHREWGIPHFIMDVPFCYELQKEKDLTYILKQYHDLIRLIERMSGQKFDIDKVYAAMGRSYEATQYWKRFLGFAAHRPSGITAFDSFVQMAPILTSRGTPELVEHFKMLVDETQERVEKGIFPVPNEKYRLLWDSIAPWHQLRKMSTRLTQLDANIVCASYTYCFGNLEGEFDLCLYDGSDPLTFHARMQNCTICPHGLLLRGRAMEEAIRRNAVDGVIFASNRSCKPYSIMQMSQQKRISERMGIPCVLIDVDHADVRKYSEENAFLRIEALLEMIDAKKAQSKQLNVA